MPMIEFVSGKLAPEVKQRLLRELTALSADITGIPKDLFLVALHELPDDDIAVGGVTVAAIKDRQREAAS